jgi:hypothetical protein
MSTENQELNSALYFTCSKCGETKHKAAESFEPGVCTSCPHKLPDEPIMFTCKKCGQTFPKSSPDHGASGYCASCECYMFKERTVQPLPKLATREHMIGFAVNWCNENFKGDPNRHTKLGLLIDFISDYHVP